MFSSTSDDDLSNGAMEEKKKGETQVDRRRERRRRMKYPKKMIMTIKPLIFMTIICLNYLNEPSLGYEEEMDVNENYINSLNGNTSEY